MALASVLWSGLISAAGNVWSCSFQETLFTLRAL
jgi:hypothetical protein